MTDIQMLSSELHRDLRVVTGRGAEYGEATHIVPVSASELRHLVLEYPVILVRDSDSGRYRTCAILGFEEGENLFLDGEEWDASYVPAHFRRQPFSLVYTAEKDGKPDPSSLVISIDMDSKRIRKDEGEALFNEDGSHSDFLKRINDLLVHIGPSEVATEVFIETLGKHDLIEPARLEVQFEGGETKSFDGLYSVSEKKLNELEGDSLAELFRRGHLQAALLMLASIGNVRKLLIRKARQGAGGAS
ncbi:MAG TPA: SapC family protein [Woeseiaceae bacterium]|nr:SapC family protein [Woeseiaceae bacterium]